MHFRTNQQSKIDSNLRCDVLTERDPRIPHHTVDRH